MKPSRLFCLVIFLVVGALCAPAQFLQVSRDGNNALISWEGEGVLQSAPDVAGPWTNDFSATSPHPVTGAGNLQLFRVWYPLGVVSLMEPPRVPPAAPSNVAAMEGPTGNLPWLSSIWRKDNYLNDDEVVPCSGEVRRMETDLIVRGRGLDFVWARCYRSRHGPNSAQGNRWDFSYNLRVEPAGAHVRVFDGAGRSDVFLQQLDGSYVANQFFREGRFDINGFFVLTFADTGLWKFLPLNGAPAAGKIFQVADRNGNTLNFLYDPLGRLTNVIDTLNRNIQVAYNADGRVESVTDFTGRQVRYEYYQDSEVGGSSGDLKSVRSPIVTGTPTVNDFPGGKTNRYSYTENFGDDRKNHLLLSVINPKGQTTREYIYQLNESDLQFLRCQTMRRGFSSNLVQFHHVAQVPANSNHFAVRLVVVNDRMGNVSEHFYDARNRQVMLREYTGRANPGQPTTETLNRPLNPLRPGDPAFFEMVWEWNVDSLPTRVLFPNGNSVSNVYELTLNSGAPHRVRGNLRERRALPGPLGGDQAELVESWVHKPGFGTGEFYDYPGAYGARFNGIDAGFPTDRGFGFVEMVTDANGNSRFLSYDVRGNCTNIIDRIPTSVEDFEYNAFGQLTARVLPDNGTGFRRRDAFTYYTGGPQAGYLQQSVVDSAAGGLNLMTTYEYDARGFLVRRVDPRGNDELWVYNALDQPVHSESRLTSIPGGVPFRQTRDRFYDANGNLVRIGDSNADELGNVNPTNKYFTTLIDYDMVDRPIRICAESGSYDVPRNPPKLDCAGLPASEFITTEFEYDRNGNPTFERMGEASEGRQPANTVRRLYDERNLLFRVVRAEGDLLQSTTQCNYDTNGNRTITFTGLEATPSETRYFYDGFNRCTSVMNAMGNVVQWNYDANGNRVRAVTYGETNDMPGFAGNIRLTEVTNVFDAMNRRIRTDELFFDMATGVPFLDGLSTTRIEYNSASQVMKVVDDNNRTNRCDYDRALRLQTVTDPAGNQMIYAYDANSNPTNVTSIEKSGLGMPDETFVTRYEYDPRDRLVRSLDNRSNAVQYAYDSRGNRVVTTDPSGAQSRYEYDGLRRPVRTIQDMNGNGANPAEPADIVRRLTWDDSSRLVSRTDDNTNVTTYMYDALNRRVREVLADGTGKTNVFDARDNLVTQLDANGNVVSNLFDLLNRVTNRTIIAGPGVMPDTTFERRRYDGLSRLVQASNDVSLVEFDYDSRSGVRRERLNGQTTSAEYDAVGNLTRRTNPSGRFTDYTFDPLNRINTILDDSNVVQCAYKYIGRDRIERMDYANGTRMEYTYDGADSVPNPTNDFGVKRLVRVRNTVVATGQTIGDHNYTWDKRGNMTGRRDSRTGGSGERFQYGYDAANRMTMMQIANSNGVPLETRGYLLDGAGNRVAVTNNSVLEFYTMNTNDAKVNQYTTTPFDTRTNDANGNVRGMNVGLLGEKRLEYDFANRLVRTVDTADNITNTFRYDALGRRIEKVSVEKTFPPVITRFVYGTELPSSGSQVVEEQNGSNQTMVAYLRGADRGVLTMQRSNSNFYLHPGGYQIISSGTDRNANPIERYDYRETSKPEYRSGSGAPIAKSSIGNPYLFDGKRQRFDDETGFYAAGNRYLDSDVGRYLSRDRFGRADNAFTHANNNPWSGGGGNGGEWLTSSGRSVPAIVNQVGGLCDRWSPPAAANTTGQQLFFMGKLAVQPTASAAAGGTINVYWHVIKKGTGTTAGDTGTHEVGHWLGLYHSHQAQGGDVDAGDYLVWRSNFGGASAADDGDTDGRDYLVWQRHPATANSTPGMGILKSTDGGRTWASGDYNGDGTVDGRDYLLWQRGGSALNPGNHTVGVIGAGMAGLGGDPDRPFVMGRLYSASMETAIESLPEIAGMFRDTADGETGHAHGHLDFLKNIGDPSTGEPIGGSGGDLTDIPEWFETLSHVP